ncbi:NCS1 family nucleobase:cation symporter-1 [Bacillus sp. 1P06AnD]|uniref:NCS1 family nucleobase:cation symporter-1 n=1 Tax=Bacillus sp. 1P06AnD TaxID=3132208 RepID=UPI0039A08328
MKVQIEENSIVTLKDGVSKSLESSPLWNEDLRPTSRSEHSWTGWSFASLWIGMCLCLPSYTMASAMISVGMNWWQALLTIFIGNCIILVPVLLNSHAGTKYGIPYPVFARLWFGSKGAHIPTVTRALISAAWFGINVWFGTTAIDTLMGVAFSFWDQVPFHTAITFAFFLLLNVIVGFKGPGAIKWLMIIASPVVGIASIFLLIWAIKSAHGLGPLLTEPGKFHTTGSFLAVFFPSVTSVIAFWATVSLNIPDFARYAKSHKSSQIGQSLALPLTMTIFSFIGIFVTSATVIVFGKAIWQPVELLAKFPTPIVFIGAIIVVLACLAVNVGANLVAPARAIENMSPKHITFGLGVLITGVLAILMQPWYLLSNFSTLLYGFLGTLGAFLGPIDGIAMADYWVVRKRRLHLAELYRPDGRYSYRSGFNMASILSFAIGILIPAIGLIVPSLSFLWENALMFGLVIAGACYTYLMRNDRSLLTSKEYEEITTRKDDTEAADLKAAAK